METKKRKRDVSRERAIALALVDVIENYGDLSQAAVCEALDEAITNAKSILETHGFKGLESISSRVAKLETAINNAVIARDGKEIARLGAELNRAQRGLPPISKTVAVKKPRKPREKKTPGNGLLVSDADRAGPNPPPLD